MNEPGPYQGLRISDTALRFLLWTSAVTPQCQLLASRAESILGEGYTQEIDRLAAKPESQLVRAMWNHKIHATGLATLLHFHLRVVKYLLTHEGATEATLRIVKLPYVGLIKWQQSPLSRWWVRHMGTKDQKVRLADPETDVAQLARVDLVLPVLIQGLGLPPTADLRASIFYHPLVVEFPEVADFCGPSLTLRESNGVEANNVAGPLRHSAALSISRVAPHCATLSDNDEGLDRQPRGAAPSPPSPVTISPSAAGAGARASSESLLSSLSLSSDDEEVSSPQHRQQDVQLQLPQPPCFFAWDAWWSDSSSDSDGATDTADGDERVSHKGASLRDDSCVTQGDDGTGSDGESSDTANGGSNSSMFSAWATPPHQAVLPTFVPAGAGLGRSTPVLQDVSRASCVVADEEALPMSTGTASHDEEADRVSATSSDGEAGLTSDHSVPAVTRGIAHVWTSLPEYFEAEEPVDASSNSDCATSDSDTAGFDGTSSEEQDASTECQQKHQQQMAEDVVLSHAARIAQWELRYPRWTLLHVAGPLVGRTSLSDIECLLELAVRRFYPTLEDYPAAVRADVLQLFGHACPKTIDGLLQTTFLNYAPGYQVPTAGAGLSRRSKLSWSELATASTMQQTTTPSDFQRLTMALDRRRARAWTRFFGTPSADAPHDDGHAEFVVVPHGARYAAPQTIAAGS